jgi:agmatine deiminase
MQFRFISTIIFISLLSAELPIGFTEEEWSNRHLIQEMGHRTDPPPVPVRNIAEFEPMQGVLIRYPFGISTSIIREMAEDVTVYCLVSSGSQNSAYNSMNNADVNMANVEFVLGATDSYWTRDYGPWWVVDGNGDIGVVDFTYNRPRPNDNQAPFKMSEHLDVPYYSADFVSAGGNYMTDGFGISASTQIAYTENDECGTNDSWSIPLAPCTYIDDIMEDYYGINQYHVVADPNNEYIDHIDCWGKFLSSTKLMIRSVPISHSQYDEIEDVVEYFESTTTAQGTPWEISRVYTPSDQPYTNSLILNNKVFVPIMSSSWDDDALAAYQEAMPSHEILPFTGSWYSTDGLHCRAKGIPDLTYTAFQPGDVNMDDTINILDIVITVNSILGTIELTPTQIQLADLNSDGNINILDIVLIVNLVLGGN